MDSLEAFNFITAKVFARCYAEFPAEIDIKIDEMELGVDEERSRALFHGTMRWLIRHKWITAIRGLKTAYWGVQLTEKALVALGWMPRPLRSCKRPSVGSRLVEAVAKGALAEVAEKLVLLAFKAAM